MLGTEDGGTAAGSCSPTPASSSTAPPRPSPRHSAIRPPSPLRACAPSGTAPRPTCPVPRTTTSPAPPSCTPRPWPPAPLTEYLRPLAERHLWTAVWAHHDVPAAAHCHLPQRDGSCSSRTPWAGSTATTRAPASAPVWCPPRGLRPRPRRRRPGGGAAVRRQRAALPLTPDEEGPAGTVLGHIAAHHGTAALGSAPSRPTALGADGRSTTAVVGDAGGAVHVWPLTAYRPLPHSHRLHDVPVTAVTCLRLPDDDLTLVFSAALDGSIRLWETSGEPMAGPVERRPALVTALAAADTPAGPLLAAAWNDAELHLWHLTSGTVRTLPLLYRCNALTLSPTGRLTLSGPDGLHTLQLALDRLWN
ncbi:hypothetical protein O1L44_23785 [Streptomyces noursei]|nr:hypothetical protein [Streptomyces noursei]